MRKPVFFIIILCFVICITGCGSSSDLEVRKDITDLKNEISALKSENIEIKARLEALEENSQPSAIDENNNIQSDSSSNTIEDNQVEHNDSNSNADKIAVSGAKDVFAEWYILPSTAEIRSVDIIEKDKFNRYILLVDMIQPNGSGGINNEKFYVLLRVEGDSYYYDKLNCVVQESDIGMSILKDSGHWDEKP